jgi:hypothetical protein
MSGVVKTYTHLYQKEKILGLEIIDFLFLAVIYAIVFLFSVNIFVNIAVVGVAFVGLKLYKKGKPHQYTINLVRFIATPKFYTLPGRDIK